jgi:cytochrome c
VARSIVMAAVLVAVAAAPAMAQDAAAGEKDFVVCRACHQIGPNAKNAVGPELNGVVGRKAGSVPGYEYSEANKNSGITWTAEELTSYLANPQKVVPHTKMVFPGFHGATADQKIKDVIAYLEQYGPDGQKK